MKFLFNFFKRKRERLGYFCLVRFSEEAIENSLGNSFLKKIVHYHDGYEVSQENYTRPKVNDLIKNGIIVLDMTAGQQVPRESVLVPDTRAILGTIQLSRRV